LLFDFISRHSISPISRSHLGPSQHGSLSKP
jgi:hypothetical protein